MDKILELYRLQPTDSISMYWLKELLVSVVIFLLFLLLARGVRYLLVHLAPRMTSFTSTDLDDRILSRLTPPVSLLVVAAGLYYSVSALPLPEKAHLVLAGAVFVVNVVILTNIAYRISDESLKWYTEYCNERQPSVLYGQLIPFLEKIISIFLFAAALIVVLKHFNYDILSLVTALGVGSLAVGMAAKDTLANMISGFTIMLDRPFRIGDRIQLAQGQMGDVVDIGLRSTKIKNPDNTVLIIPNSDLCNRTVVNMAFPNSVSQGKVSLGVGYGSDVERVKSILVETALEIPDVLREPAPSAFFASFGDSALNLQLFFWVSSYGDVFSVVDRVNCRILERLRSEGIEIPFPTRTVNLHGAPTSQ